MSILITVFTATYNRAHLLPKLFDSLKRQSCSDFEWLVIDDGSVDDTKELFRSYQQEKLSFKLNFYTQENQGLIRSLNRGISLAEGEYFVKMDSDDYVVDDFVENLVSWIKEIDGFSDIYAVGGVRVTEDGEPIKGTWPLIPKDGFIDATDLERAKFNLNADMTEAWRLSVLRKYPFPVWPTEKFAPEQIVFYKIALNGFKIRWRSVPLTICEYQEGGLTLGANNLVANNPMGYSMMYEQLLDRPDYTLLQKVKCATNMISFSLMGGNPFYSFKGSHKFIAALTYFAGLALYLKRRFLI